MGYSLNSYDAIQSTVDNNPYTSGSTDFITCESSRLVYLKKAVNQPERKNFRERQIQELTGLINAWKNTPVRERAKLIIGSLVCFAAAVTVAIIAYHCFAFILFLTYNPPVAAVVMNALGICLGLMAGPALTRIGVDFARFAFCSTECNINYLEQMKKGFENEVQDVEEGVRVLAQLAKVKLKSLADQSTEYGNLLKEISGAGQSVNLADQNIMPVDRRVFMSAMGTCVNETTRILAALEKLRIAIPDVYTQQPVTG